MWQLFVMLPFLGFVAYMYTRNKKLMEKAKTDYAHFQAGLLAPRLGMKLTAGDPTFNVVATPAQTAAKKVPGSKYDAEIELRMEGRPYGHSTELYMQYTFDTKLTGSQWSWIAGFTMSSRAELPPFELTRKSAGLTAQFTGQGLAAQADLLELEELELPKQKLGRADLDERYELRSADPGLAARLAPALAPFASMDHVHLIGHDGQVRLRISQAAFTMTMYHAEQMLYGLAGVVASLEGKPAPQMATFDRAAA